METTELPLLRYREDDEDVFFEHPVTIMGHVTSVDEDCATITQGPSTSHSLYMEDLASIFDEDDDTALAVMLDAREHNDLVKIELRADRLTYSNEAQAKRFA